MMKNPKLLEPGRNPIGQLWTCVRLYCERSL